MFFCLSCKVKRHETEQQVFQLPDKKDLQSGWMDRLCSAGCVYQMPLGLSSADINLAEWAQLMTSGVYSRTLWIWNASVECVIGRMDWISRLCSIPSPNTSTTTSLAAWCSQALSWTLEHSCESLELEIVSRRFRSFDYSFHKQCCFAVCKLTDCELSHSHPSIYKVISPVSNG